MTEPVTINFDVRAISDVDMERVVRERIFPLFMKMLRENRGGATASMRAVLGKPPGTETINTNFGSVSTELYRSATPSLKWQMVGDVPRRCRVDLATPAERVIRDAIAAVEDLPADTRLTDAVVLLGQALSKVADFVEDIT